MMLFLDFDGVLHPEHHNGAVFCKLPLLWRILDEVPDAQVVLSTNWREHYPVDELLAFLAVGEGHRYLHRIVGTTPILSPHPLPDYYRSRERECISWLEGNGIQDSSWLAIDDMASWFSYSSPHLYLVDYRTGLTEADVPAILWRINTLSRTTED